MTLRQRFNHTCALPLQYVARRVTNKHGQIALAALYGIVDTFGPFSASAIILKPIFDSYTERLRQVMKERNRENAKRGKSTVPGV